MIKVHSAAKQETEPSADWAQTIKMGREIESLAKDFQSILEELTKKHRALNEKVIEAYKSAPLTDCGFNVSPIGPQRMLYAMKNHLRKNGFIMDNAYVGDTTKLPDYVDYVKDAVRWLTKFSTLK